MLIRAIAATVLLLTVSAPLVVQAQDGREIMEKMEDYQRATSDSAFNRMQMSSCLYGVKDSRITCAERPRIKAIESVGINFGEDKKDTKSIAIVLEPPAEKGIGMLSFNYDDSSRDNQT